MTPIQIVAGIAAALLVIALGPWPLWYYVLLRVAICAAGLYCGVMLWNAGQQHKAVAVALSVAALVFNPLVPAPFTRAIWSVLDVVVAGLFGYVAARPPM